MRAALVTKITAEQLHQLDRAIGKKRCMYDNPTGVIFVYDEDNDHPFGICDDQHGEWFESFEELLEAATAWEQAE